MKLLYTNFTSFCSEHLKQEMHVAQRHHYFAFVHYRCGVFFLALFITRDWTNISKKTSTSFYDKILNEYFRKPVYSVMKRKNQSNWSRLGLKPQFNKMSFGVNSIELVNLWSRIRRFTCANDVEFLHYSLWSCDLCCHEYYDQHTNSSIMDQYNFVMLEQNCARCVRSLWISSIKI